jgi:hypothetical protein
MSVPSSAAVAPNDSAQSEAAMPTVEAQVHLPLETQLSPRQKIPVLSLVLEPIRQGYLRKGVKLSYEARKILNEVESLMNEDVAKNFRNRISA